MIVWRKVVHAQLECRFLVGGQYVLCCFFVAEMGVDHEVIDTGQEFRRPPVRHCFQCIETLGFCAF